MKSPETFCNRNFVNFNNYYFFNQSEYFKIIHLKRCDYDLKK